MTTMTQQEVGEKYPQDFVCPKCGRTTTQADMFYTGGNCIEYGNLCGYDEALSAKTDPPETEREERA